MIRPLAVADVGAVADVHMAAFPGRALTRLGPGLVARYYQWLLTGPHDAVALGSFGDDGRLVGFVFAGRFHRALSGFVNANRGALAMRVATRPWLLGNEVVRGRLSSSWRWVFRRRLPPSAPVGFGVLAIAVHPARQRSGGGRALMACVEEAAAARGFSAMHLTVEPTNAGAVAFYERQGWRRDLSGGEWQGRMVKELGYDATVS